MMVVAVAVLIMLLSLTVESLCYGKTNRYEK